MGRVKSTRIVSCLTSEAMTLFLDENEAEVFLVEVQSDDPELARKLTMEWIELHGDGPN